MKGSRVVITGGGRGIGAASAAWFVKEGARVLIASRTESELLSVAAQIKEEMSSAEIHHFVVDVSDERSVEDLFLYADQVLGGVDVLVNNAARIAVETVDEITLGSWQKTMDVNLTGAFLCAKQAFMRMKSGGGSIINLSSLGGLQNTEKFKGFLSYSVSKFGMVGMTECLAVEGKEFGIRVNCVAPGAVKTRMLAEAAPFIEPDAMPEDIASVIGYLADSNRARVVTGAVMEVKSNG